MVIKIWHNSDILVIYANQEQHKTVDIVRQLDYTLPSDVQVVVVENPALLESQFGIVPDNYIWTVRFISKHRPAVGELDNQSQTKEAAFYKFNAADQVWRKVALKIILEQVSGETIKAALHAQT